MDSTVDLSNLYGGNSNGFAVLQSHAGQGRSRYAQHMIYEERRKGLNTLIISSDLGTLQLHAMQVAKHMYVTNPSTALSDNQILHKQYDADQAAEIHTALLDMDKKGFGHFVAEYLPQVTLELIEATLEKLWIDGHRFDFVVIDGGIVDGGTSQSKVVNELDNLSKTFKGVGFRGLLSLQLRHGIAVPVNPTELPCIKLNEGNKSLYAVTLSNDKNTVSAQVTDLTGNEVLNKVEILKATYRFCDFEKE